MPKTAQKPPKGRFAPSPTGELHLGSLTTAVASYCHIKSLGGTWLLRIEDVDWERCHLRHVKQILTDLEILHLHADEVVYQSERLPLYEMYITQKSRLIYPCNCSRKQLAAFDTPLYPRLCTPNAGTTCLPSNQKLRIMLPDRLIAFCDGIQGIQWQNPQKLLGDVVIKRQNGIINYLWACAIDDGSDDITHVMRGLDILPMTAAQLFILEVLSLAAPTYFYHLPLLYNIDGQKLSKQNLACPLDTQKPAKLLTYALALLGQPVPKTLSTATPTQVLEHAIWHWDTALIPKNSLGVAR